MAPQSIRSSDQAEWWKTVSSVLQCGLCIYRCLCWMQRSSTKVPEVGPFPGFSFQTDTMLTLRKSGCPSKCESEQWALWGPRLLFEIRVCSRKEMRTLHQDWQFCAINIVYGLFRDALSIWIVGEKGTTDTCTREFPEITQMLKSFPGAMVFNRSLHDKPSRWMHSKNNNNPAAAWNNSTPTSAAHFEKGP